MTREALTAHIGELADAVLADWRWVRDDLNVSVLGMLLYGFAAGLPDDRPREEDRAAEERAVCDLVRCVFGNPFRAVLVPTNNVSV